MHQGCFALARAFARPALNPHTCLSLRPTPCSGAAQHSWLAPLDGAQGNELRVVLDAPVLLGALRLWNYAKTPSRGVQQLEVYLDECLVWKVGRALVGAGQPVWPHARSRPSAACVCGMTKSGVPARERAAQS